jgi:hypothetical protein
MPDMMWYLLLLQIVHLKKEKQRLTVELAAMAAEANAAVQERNDLLAMHQVCV